jgi:redox-sensitive bicupin YhaK (pirin superfamily)
MKQRKIDRITANPSHPGFLGEGHIATPVLGGQEFENTDPFIMLMDDRLNLPGGEPVGGPHPHAGFETVTFVLKGNGHEWKTGTMELMTAGKGIVHTEEISTKTDVRILQLWLALPPGKRWTEPFFQKILVEDVPTVKTFNSEVRVYSGSSNGLTSPMQNHTPFTLVDLEMGSNAEVTQQLPASYNGFIYVIEGSVWVSGKKVEKEQAGWFDLSDQQGESEVIFHTEDTSARFVLYAAQPHHVPIVSHGPFIADTEDDIRRLYREFRNGLMPHVNDLPKERRLVYGGVEVS